MPKPKLIAGTPITDDDPLQVQESASSPANATLGGTTDAAVSTDANGSINAHLRGLVVLLVNFLSRFPAALGLGGGLKVEGFGPTHYTNFGVAAKANIKGSAGSVHSVAFFNANATVRYAQLHNKATAPAGADVPKCSYPIPAGTVNNPGSCIIEISHLASLAFGTGIGFAVSTTLATFTDAATPGDHSVEVMYS